ncbi:hypothetical protein [Enterococcus faecium]|uniref:hypothetical protein n=1 Tax=Enterococcus faecium TaxID=1352 RepID=UPI001FD7F504|nr:hypothetical protein [Enterococcus faecium]
MIPGDLKSEDYGIFFESLDKQEELSKEYMRLNDRSYDGTSNGLLLQMNVTADGGQSRGLQRYWY